MQSARFLHASPFAPKEIKTGGTTSSIRAALFATLVAFVFARQATAAAGLFKAHSIRGAKALITTDATAHFGCELSSFTTGFPCYGPQAIRKAYGTNASAPQWAGIVAIANQKSGKPLGFLNKSLYRLGKAGTLRTVMNDITVGDNSLDGVPGFAATPGWDFATGWGRPNAALVQSLVRDND